MNRFYEKLIYIVKDYKIIYDINDKNYTDFQKKHDTWNEIGMKLKTSGKECKRSWCLLRDSFRRALKKKKDPQNPDKKWRYSDEMAFLIPYMREKPHRFPNHYSDDIFQEDANRSKSVHSPAVSEQSIPEPLQKKRKAEAPSSAELIKYILESQKGQPPDDIEKFFAGITSTVRSFPMRDRAMAKARIFEIVSQMELEILSRPSTSEPSSSTPICNVVTGAWDDSLTVNNEPTSMSRSNVAVRKWEDSFTVNTEQTIKDEIESE